MGLRVLVSNPETRKAARRTPRVKMEERSCKSVAGREVTAMVTPVREFAFCTARRQRDTLLSWRAFSAQAFQSRGGDILVV